MTNNTPTPKLGRPRKWDDPELMQKTINEYFQECQKDIMHVQKVSAGAIIKIPTPRPATMSGLARALNIERHVLNRYRKGEHELIDDEDEEKFILFSSIIACARKRIEEQNISCALIGVHESRAANLNLASNFGFSQKSEHTLAGPDGKALDTKVRVEFVDADKE